MRVGQVLVMRHAEKPDDAGDPNLSPAGFQRAENLVPYVQEKFGKPSFLFAAATSAKSRRPLQTIQPLSNALSVAVDASIGDKDYEQLAVKLLNGQQYEGCLTVVCWHHEKIRELAHALRAQHGDYPDPWQDDVFNLILRFDFADGIPKVKEITEPF
ncbi:hypothetical protein [Bradyrhizobium genosp. A]|uniref:hypothetical protein n=1 Tax=Bradyrhizobium genosp. A TaxID=83626 RepID=UPI003CF1FFED